MKKSNKKTFKEQTLPGLETLFPDDGIDEEPNDPLALSIVGQGESRIAQFVDLLTRMGLERAYRLCKKYEIYGINKEQQLVVDVKCGSRKEFYKCEKENGVTYYIYANNGTPSKKGYLAKLSDAMQKEHAEKMPEPEPPPPEPPIEDTHPGHRRKDSNFSVTFEDGTVIAEKMAKDSFAKAIEHIGPESVDGLGLVVNRMSLVGKTRIRGKYASSLVMIKGGWFVLTQSSTKAKIKMLNRIANALDLKIEIQVR